MNKRGIEITGEVMKDLRYELRCVEQSIGFLRSVGEKVDGKYLNRRRELLRIVLALQIATFR